MNVRIDGGCMKLPDGRWMYSIDTVKGFTSYVFAATSPNLGDSLSVGEVISGRTYNATWTPRPIVPNPSSDALQFGWPEPIINNDPGKVQKRNANPDDYPYDTHAL